MVETDIKELNERIQKESAFVDMVTLEMHKVIIGQKHMIERLLIGLLADGHILLEGVPGLAKTLAIKSLAGIIDAKFSRIQFTPDLLPADLVGTQIYSQKKEEFKVRKGPIFANFVLADEINRSPAKVQSALLEAMQERQVTIGDTTYPLPSPFLVLATQNPIEQEGTYPLPEAQVDRFMLKCIIRHPSRDDERRIMNRFTNRQTIAIDPVLSATDVEGLRSVMDQVYCDEKVGEYILDIVFATRDPKAFKLDDLVGRIEMGASPRATLYLNLAARANAMLHGRAYATPQDVKEIAPDVLRHRILLTYEAEAEEITSEKIVDRILSTIPVP